MATNFVPTREADLLAWSRNFDNLITATPTAYGLTAAQATAYTTLHTNFANALQLATEPSTRTPVAVRDKNIAKDALIDGPGGIRELARIVQATPTVTDGQREALGISPRTEREVSGAGEYGFAVAAICEREV